MTEQHRLNKAVKAIVDSYQVNPHMACIDRQSIPAKEDILKLIKDIQELLFPGFSRPEVLSSLDIHYVIGHRTASVFNRLKTYIQQLLNWQQHTHGTGCREEQAFQDCVEDLAMKFLEYIPQMRDILAEDIEAFFDGDPASVSREEVVVSYPGLHALCIHRVAHFFYQHTIPMLPRILSEYMHSQTGIDIHPGAKIGRGIMIDHGTGIVIGETSEIGDFVRIYQGVTIGALSPMKKPFDPTIKRHPTIEDHVVIYAGATILGGQTVVGANSVIGGNVWLTQSVPPNSRVFQQRS